MITAIFVKDSATLTFALDPAETKKPQLEQMGLPASSKPLTTGLQVKVGTGVFRVLSGKRVTVQADAPIGLVTADDKDGGPIDPPKLLKLLNPTAQPLSGLDENAVHSFVFPAALGHEPR